MKNNKNNNFKYIAILTSPTSWFVPYTKKLKKEISNNYKVEIFFEHKEIPDKYEVIFILSYFKIIEKGYLEKHKHNIVLHESNLPKGKGWAPLFWQILKGKNKIPIVLFEATKEVDAGKIYLKDHIKLKGHELNKEIRKLQAQKQIEMCLKFLNAYNKIKPNKQKGSSSFYKRRTPLDSQLNINKSIKSQFNLLRIVNNKKFPAFFIHKGQKYTIKISKSKSNH